MILLAFHFLSYPPHRRRRCPRDCRDSLLCVEIFRISIKVRKELGFKLFEHHRSSDVQVHANLNAIINHQVNKNNCVGHA